MYVGVTVVACCEVMLYSLWEECVAVCVESSGSHTLMPRSSGGVLAGGASAAGASG